MTKRASSKLSGEIRFVDLCAGLGGFHHAFHLAEAAQAQRDDGAKPDSKVRFRCVLAAELDPRLRKLYVENFGESLRESYRKNFPVEPAQQLAEGLRLGNPSLAEALSLYDANGQLQRIHGDLTALLDDTREGLRCWPGDDPSNYIVPEHDLLCAGFPCQPFSKSGAQRGFMDDTRGTVFHTLAKIIQHRRPRLVLLENVGNFERHDEGNTWQHVCDILKSLNYDVRATTQVGSSGRGGLLSPHHVGFPHHRERFFIVAQHRDSQGEFAEHEYPFPVALRGRSPEAEAQRNELDARASQRLSDILAGSSPTATEAQAAVLHPEREHCLEHWNGLLLKIAEYERTRVPKGQPSLLPMPSFPIWGYELDPWNHYPTETNPAALAADLSAATEWRRKRLMREMQPFGEAGNHPPSSLAPFAGEERSREATEQWLSTLPAYARGRSEWPKWKQQYIEQNRSWAKRLWAALPANWFRPWLDELMTMIASHQKLEWNCQGGELDLRQHILQFRPSGLRTKRFGHVPALVAMTTTQIPVVPLRAQVEDGPETLTNRHLLSVEALQLQGFPANWKMPASRDDAFRALGNAVHAGLVSEVVQRWLFSEGGTCDSSLHSDTKQSQLSLVGVGESGECSCDDVSAAPHVPARRAQRQRGRS